MDDTTGIVAVIVIGSYIALVIIAYINEKRKGGPPNDDFVNGQ